MTPVGGFDLPARRTAAPLADPGRLPDFVSALVQCSLLAVDNLAACLEPAMLGLTAEQVDTLATDVLEVVAIARHLGDEVQAEVSERDRIARQVVASLTRQAGA